MAYIYGKNQKEIKKKLSRKGIVVKMIERTSKRFNLDGQRRYFVSVRPSMRRKEKSNEKYIKYNRNDRNLFSSCCWNKCSN